MVDLTIKQYLRQSKNRNGEIMNIEDQKDPLFRSAWILVSAAGISASTIFTALQKKFSILENTNYEHSNFIIRISIIFIAVTRLNNLNLSDDYEDRLLDVVTKELALWDPDSTPAFEDCKAIFESEFDRLTKDGHEPRFVASDAVGMWITLNLLERLPQSEEELNLVRTSGVEVTGEYFDWWERLID